MCRTDRELLGGWRVNGFATPIRFIVNTIVSVSNYLPLVPAAVVLCNVVV